MTKGDYRSMLRYRALAVDICHQLDPQESLLVSIYSGPFLLCSDWDARSPARR
jgi:hypothetical protein